MSSLLDSNRNLKCHYCGKRIMKDPFIQTLWINGKVSIGYVYCSRECALADSL